MQKIIFSIFFLSLIIPLNIQAVSIGAQCTADTDCDGSIDCEKSNLSIQLNNFCVCQTAKNCADTYGGSESEWTCTNTDTNYHKLHYCQKIATQEIKDPLGLSTDPDIKKLDKSTDAKPQGVSSVNYKTGLPIVHDVDITLKKPVTKIKIPGVEFSDITKTQEDDGVYLNIPFLSEYLAGIYKYIILISSIIAIVVIIFSGIQWMTPPSSNIDSAKKRIITAVIGLILIVSSYTILYTINPELVQFRNLKVLYIKETSFTPHEDHDDDKNYSSPISSVSKANFKLNQTYPGEKQLGRCHIVPTTDFPTFDLSGFGDDSNGRCLLQEYEPNIGTAGASAPDSNVTKITFLGKKITVNKKISAIMQKIDTEIKKLQSPIVQYWVKNFYTPGASVNSVPATSALKKCQEDGPETWIVVSGDNKNHLLTRVLKNLHGNYDDSIHGDLHSLGIAIDMYSKENWDFVSNGNITRPMVTQIPAEVAQIFYNNKFQWLGAVAGRDPMHFQYYGSTCFSGLNNNFPSGNGCCMNPWTNASRAPKYNTCIQKGGQSMTYEHCLGSQGKAGNMWIKESINPK